MVTYNYKVANASQQYANYIQTHLYLLCSYLRCQNINDHEKRVFFNYAALMIMISITYDDLCLCITAFMMLLLTAAPNASVNYCKIL